ncbi:hypothetical protein R6Q57_001505 [Mikania cordata]
MPQDLPGFYFDVEKNRYFPLKSPFPGSSSRDSSSAQKTPPKSSKGKNGQHETTSKVVKMLHARELCGNSIFFKNKKVNFQEQYQNMRTSRPTIWKYQWTDRIIDTALEHVYVNIQTQDGLVESELLLVGGLNNAFRIYEVGYVEQYTSYERNYIPDVVQLLNIENQTSLIPPRLYWIGDPRLMDSNVSCIKISRNYYHPQATDVDSSVSHAVITTLGSETPGGSVYVINLTEPFDSWRDGDIDLFGHRLAHCFSISKSTIWTADCNSNGNQTVVGIFFTGICRLASTFCCHIILDIIGTDSGAALIHIESGRRSWIFRSKSDVLSLQFDPSGNVVLCGLRNGAILTVDTRQKPQELHDRHLPKHQMPFPSLKTTQSSKGRGKKREDKWFEVRGDVHHSQTMFMPSSVSSLVALKLYDQYFLASSMDGTGERISIYGCGD